MPVVSCLRHFDRRGGSDDDARRIRTEFPISRKVAANHEVYTGDRRFPKSDGEKYFAVNSIEKPFVLSVYRSESK